MKTQKRLSNTEFVTKLMEFSPHGALCQAFVLQAIEQFAEKVVKAGVKAQDPEGFVSPEAWVGTAQHIVDEFAKRNAS